MPGPIWGMCRPWHNLSPQRIAKKTKNLGLYNLLQINYSIFYTTLISLALRRSSGRQSSFARNNFKRTQPDVFVAGDSTNKTACELNRAKITIACCQRLPCRQWINGLHTPWRWCSRSRKSSVVTSPSRRSNWQNRIHLMPPIKKLTQTTESMSKRSA